MDDSNTGPPLHSWDDLLSDLPGLIYEWIVLSTCKPLVEGVLEDLTLRQREELAGAMNVVILVDV